MAGRNHEYNQRKSMAAAQAKPAREQARRSRDARLAVAEADLLRAIGPDKAAYDAQTRAQLDEHQRARDAWWEQHARTRYDGAYRAYDAALALAEEIYYADLQDANRPLAELEAEWTARKEAAKREQWAASPAGQKNAQAAAAAAAAAQREWDAAVARGLPSAAWARWLGSDLPPESDNHPDRPGSTWAQAALWRDRWLALHPEHYHALHNPSPDAWDRMEVEAAGGQWLGSTRADRGRWPA